MLYICFTQNLSTPSLPNHCLFVFSYLDGTARLANHRCCSSGWYRKVSCRLYYCKSIISSSKYIPLNLKHFAKCKYKVHVGRVKRIWYLSPMRAAKVQASLRIWVSQEEPSDRKPDPWPLWMAGHAQLKFVMTECSKTQIRLTRPM